MRLLCPIKSGTFRNWAQNIQLKNLDEFFKCETQGFGVINSAYDIFGLKGHNGLDIAYEDGTEVFAAHDGTVDFQEDSYKGLGAVVTTDGYKTIYWHLKEYAGVNRKVKAGELIGYGDSTGYSTGPHLHFGLKLLSINNEVLNRDNGYDGAVDPTPFIVWPDNETMTKEEVQKLQALEGYSDPDGVAYWTGQSLSAYLEARIKDKIASLQNTQNS